MDRRKPFSRLAALLAGGVFLAAGLARAGEDEAGAAGEARVFDGSASYSGEVRDAVAGATTQSVEKLKTLASSPGEAKKGLAPRVPPPVAVKRGSPVSFLSGGAVGAALTTLAAWATSAGTQLGLPALPPWLLGAAPFVAVIAATVLGSRAVAAWVEGLAAERGVQGNYKVLLVRLASLAPYVVGGMALLALSGMSVVQIVTALGLGTVAATFAMQQMVSNLFGGMMALQDRRFNIGDRIKVDGVEGVVADMTLSHVKLRLPDGASHFVPNSKFNGEGVTVFPKAR